MEPKDSVDLQNLFAIKGKVALITGGSRGIGLMIARGFLEAGAKVYIAARKKEACEQAAKDLQEVGECIPLVANISTAAGCAALASEVAAREQRLHILVNNAGAVWLAPIAEYPESGWDKVIDTNLKSVFFMTREALSLLDRAATPDDPARVINVGSIDGIKAPFIETYAYPASKAAVHHLTRDMAVKLAGRYITVNAIAPGPFESQMTKWMLANFQNRFEQACPLHRIGRPGDMAGVAIYLASRAGSYVNGVVIPVDGGYCLT